MAMRKKIIGFEIFVDFHEMQIFARSFASAAGAGFAVGNHGAAGSEPAALGQWMQSQDDAGGVTARISDEASFRKSFRSISGGVKLRQAIDRLLKPQSIGRGELVPRCEGLFGLEAECTA